MWSYPWDIRDQGIAEAAADLRGRAGLDTVSLAVSCRAGRFLRARSPEAKVYAPENGAVHYRPDPSLWDGKEMVPVMARDVDERGDLLGEMMAAQRDGGMKVSCWTVCLNNPRLGALHPGHVTRNAFGDPDPDNLCPSSPAARDYAVTLVKDVTRRYRPDMVELEAANFAGFAHAFLPEADGVGLTVEDNFLLSLCFCDHCMARAAKAGVDGAAAKATVRRLIADLCEREVPERHFPSFPRGGIDAFADWPALHAYLAWRAEPVASLIAAIRAETDPTTQVVLIDPKDGWMGGIDLKAVGRACDGAILCSSFMDAQAVTALISNGRDVMGADKFLGAGFRVYSPEITCAEDLTARVGAALDAGAHGLRFHNYGLIPAKRLDWVGRAIKAKRKR